MNQECAQALVELLFLAVNLDDRLTMPENEVLEKALVSLGWSHGGSGPVDVTKAYQAVSAVTHCEAKTEEFLQSRAKLLKGAGHGIVAYDWIGRILGADGIDAGERYFLDRLERMLIG
ncbi:MAG: hypothetical protein J0M04_01635 [Verrucomicrobia bacterium]|nr:hypothetical protein [Verrucomicrobiota bacterium]